MTQNTSSLSINGHSASIRIDVLRYELASAQNASDANWLACYVVTDFGPVTGNYSASFTTSDFVRFRVELARVLDFASGSAAFVTDEESLNLTVEMRKTGTALVKGTAKLHQQVTLALSFSFESDQSFLTETLRELDNILKQFPVRTEAS